MQDDIPDRIDAAIKMLSARGNALDLEAVKLIKELKGVADFTVKEHLIVAGKLEAARNKIADLYIERDQEQSNADNLADENNALRDEIDELEAKLDAVGPMRRDKAEERHRDMADLVAENLMLRDAVRKHKVPVTVVPRPLMEDAASVRGAFVELAEVSEKLAKVLGRPLKDEDTPLLLADEVEREMIIARMEGKIAQKITEQHLKTHQDYCAANHVWKAAPILPPEDGTVFINTVQSWMEGEPVGVVAREPAKVEALKLADAREIYERERIKALAMRTVADEKGE